ncbi:hypothetical protein BDW_04715 [Bdellovibrio bacteriovorus W]|nr:hypothetical protein BDW_04715 [Bdellovibrio bacteriovorus W]
MKKIVLTTIALLAFSAQSYALNKESIDGKDALAIVKTMEALNIKGQAEGSDDTGYVRIRSYSLLGMECVTGWSAYGGYGSELEGSCHFDRVKSDEDLKKIKSILKAGGLATSNKIFK